MGKLLNALITPAVFDFWAQHLNKSWAWERVLARVTDVVPASADATTITFRPNRNFHGFLPGQHINVTLPVNGVHHTRSYSLNHTPRTNGTLSITVRHEPGGIVSHAISDLKPGNLIELGQAFGDFRLPEANGAVLLLAGGSGITPLMSLLEARLSQGHSAPVTLLYSVSQKESACFTTQLNSLAEQHRNFQWRLKISGSEGRIEASDILSLVPNPSHTTVLICGSHGFASSMKPLCHDFENIQSEAFSAPDFSRTGDANITVTLARSGQQLSVSNGGVLLNELEARGLTPAHGCRLGICNTCACPRLEGTTENLRDQLFSHNPGGMVRLCISRAVTDITLDL